MTKEQQQILNHNDPESEFYFAGVGRRVMLARKANPRLTYEQALEVVKIRALTDVNDAILQLNEVLEYER